MAADEEPSGRASGYSVEDDPERGFRWSAVEPAGMLAGHTDSRVDAEAAARSAEQELPAATRDT